MIGDFQKGGVQTSFIPKKPLVSYGKRDSAGAGGIIVFISIIVFVASIAVFGGAFLYRTQLKSSISSINTQLAGVKADLESKDSLMKEMVRFDTKLNVSNELLNTHISLRNLFALLEETTLQNLRFNEFNYTDKDGQIEIGMGGEAGSYATIALEAKELADSKKTGDRDFSNIIFSDLNPGLTGNVVFKMTATARPELVYYSNLDAIKGGL